MDIVEESVVLGDEAFDSFSGVGAQCQFRSGVKTLLVPGGSTYCPVGADINGTSNSQVRNRFGEQGEQKLPSSVDDLYKGRDGFLDILVCKRSLKSGSNPTKHLRQWR